MVEEANPSAGGGGTWTCPRCGAPLPSAGADGFATCDYCGVRTQVSQRVPTQLMRSGPEELASPPGLSFESDDEGFGGGDHPYLFRGVIAVALLVVLFVVIAATQPVPTPVGPSPSTPHCSVTISASATSGPAPFTATFTAEITRPAGVSTGEPMWQFGPIPPLDTHYTVGNPVTHTWITSGTWVSTCRCPTVPGRDATTT